MIRSRASYLRQFTSVARLSRPQNGSIKTLEDLAKLKSLDDVDPELVKRLINERTNELNIHNELQMLKNMQSEEKRQQEVSLKKFVRPAWIFLLMSSLVYLSGHYVWWRLEYDERQATLQREVLALQEELDAEIAGKQKESASDSNRHKNTSKKWYRGWLW